jgi:S1-C subfamily serine protease
VTGAIGTGFFVSPDGFLLTAAHVVKNAKSITLETKQGTVSARVVQVDTANDAALLKAEGRFLCLAVTPSRNVKLGADVFTVGFPNIDLQGAAPKLTKGSINALSGIQDDPRAFQISVPVQPGNSGGPLLDATGNVIGVVVSQLDAVKTALITGSLPQGVNYAVKSAYVQPLLDAIPETSALPSPVKPRSFEDAVRAAETAVCIVLTYE